MPWNPDLSCSPQLATFTGMSFFIKTTSRFILLAVTALFYLPTSTHANYPYKYSDNGDGTCTITNYFGEGGDITIPDVMDGLFITAIGSNTFANMSNLTTVTMGTNVLAIGNAAFQGCVSLSDVTIGASVSYIDHYAFSNCLYLTTVNFKSNAPSMGAGVFLQCDRAFVFYRPGTTGWNAPTFGGCPALLQALDYNCRDNGDGSYAIFNYTGTDGNITIPDTINSQPVTAIGIGGLNAVFYLNPTVTNVTLGANVTTIESYAFAFSPYLANVFFGANVASIGQSAFSFDNAMSSIVLPASLTNIGDAAFAPSSITAIYFRGTAPILGGVSVYNPATTTAYYLPCATNGWDTWPGMYGLTPVVWNPLVVKDADFGVHTNNFGFTISGPTNATIIVEACTNLEVQGWMPVSTNTLTGGTSSFNDQNYLDHPDRCFYRFRAP